MAVGHFAVSTAPGVHSHRKTRIPGALLWGVERTASSHSISGRPMSLNKAEFSRYTP